MTGNGVTKWGGSQTQIKKSKDKNGEKRPARGRGRKASKVSKKKQQRRKEQEGDEERKPVRKTKGSSQPGGRRGSFLRNKKINMTRSGGIVRSGRETILKERSRERKVVSGAGSRKWQGGGGDEVKPRGGRARGVEGGKNAAGKRV